MALTDSLVAYWALEETSGSRLDSVGSEVLSDNNTVTSATGKVGDAAQFTAANSEYLSRADDATLSGADIDLTIQAWVKLTSKSAEGVIVSKFGAGGSREYMLRYDTGTDRFQFWADAGIGSATVEANNLGSPSTGVWYHIIAWHDSVNNALGISVNDGTVNNSGTYTDGIADTTEDFRIGARGGPTGYFDGLIDEVGLWKRLLLTAERTWLYNSGSGRAFSEFPNYGIVYGGGGIGGNFPLRWRTYRPRPFAPGLAR